MMENLGVEHGCMVKCRSATLPKGNYVKLRPQAKSFLDIANPKAVLENTLRNFSALTKVRARAPGWDHLLTGRASGFSSIGFSSFVLSSLLRYWLIDRVGLQGATIRIFYNAKQYDIDVVDIKPRDAGAISIVDTDVNVDFDAPADYVEPEYKPKPRAAAQVCPAPVHELSRRPILTPGSDWRIVSSSRAAIQRRRVRGRRGAC